MPSYSRSFVLKTAQDTTPVPCKWKPGTKKHGPQATITEAFVTVRHVATIALNEWMLEFYQSAELTAETPLEDVFNIPLVSELLIYPVIMRVTGMQEAPSLGRVKKFLCEYLIQNADHSFFPEDEDVEDEIDVPALSDEEDLELPEDDDDDEVLSSSDLSEEEEDDEVDPEDEEDEEEADVMDDEAAY
jgi:hypothetical protein